MHEFCKKVNRERFYFSNENFQVWWLNSGMEVMKKYKISVQYP